MEVDVSIVNKVFKKIFNDISIRKNNKELIVLKYKFSDFERLIPHRKTFDDIISYLPYLNYKSRPFVLSVAHRKSDDTFEITVINLNRNK